MTKEERVELLYTLVLTLVPNIGPVTAKKLIALCGSAQNIFNHIGRRKMAHLNGLRMNLVRELKLDSLVTKANLILETIEKNIGKNKGTFKFTREESRKTGEG